MVDLPGYGYAKVSKETKKHWDKVLTHFFTHNKNIAAVIQIVDIRNALQDNDMVFIDWITSFGLNLVLLLNKEDKISKNQARQKLFEIRRQLQDIPNVTVKTFSASKKTGIVELKEEINVLTDQFVQA